MVDPELGRESEDVQECFKRRMKSCFQRIMKPCFGLSLTWASKVVALLDLVVAVFSIVLTVVDLFLQDPSKDDENAGFGLSGFYMIKMAFTIFLSVILFRSSCHKDLRTCKIWLLISIILLLASVSVFISYWVLYPGSFSSLIASVFVIFCLYRGYTLIVIYEYINELKLSDCTSMFQKRPLKPREIDEFIHGNSLAAIAAAKASDPAAEAEHKPYSNDLEICMDRLIIDQENPIETGEFVLVLKGNLKLTDGSSSLVTVKKITSDANITFFKTMLSELKTLAYVSEGNHDNVVNLIGACTVDIRQRNLCILLEFCPFGNMQTYLKQARKGFFVNLVKKGKICRDYALKHYCNVHALMQTEMVTTFDLIRWCLEITEGMKYLSSKGVIHADLSAKNVFLSNEKVAKISNMGLSRQLYHCRTKGSFSEDSDLLTPPPPSWRWLAIESLRDFKFSTQSDIWALGVTIWEIFSLGDTPFPRMTWNPEFVECLSSGLRMNKATFATDATHTLLLECWDNAPDNRPSLHRISNFFEEILRNHNMMGNVADVPFNNGPIRGTYPSPKERHQLQSLSLNQDSSCDSSRSNSHSSNNRRVN